MNPPINRRMIIGVSLSLIAAEAFAGRRQRDRGIGGTGVVVDPGEGDRGIGGTGVIGTIREFGSIIVNDMRIAYPTTAEVEIDGRIANLKELRLGQVVQTVASTDGAGFSTNRIVITSEVVGPIEHIAHGRLTVLGQTVATDFIDAKGLKKGQWIAVSGLRDLDGAIYASYVQRRDDSLAQVVGPVSVSNGVARIGGLPLANLDTGLEGRRVLAFVGRIDGQPAAISVTPDPERAVLGNVRRLSIESYVMRKGGDIHMGSGLVAAAPTSQAAAAPNAASVRAVVAVTVNADSSLTATSVRTVSDPSTAPAADSPPKNTTPTEKTTQKEKPVASDKNDDTKKSGRDKTDDSKNESLKNDASKNAPPAAPSPPEPLHWGSDPPSTSPGGSRRR